jgi:signal transduction histidine kinase
LVVVATGGLVVRRVWPVVALAVSLGATLLYLAFGYPYSPILQLSSLAAYSVGAWCSGRVSLAAVVVAVGVYVPDAWLVGGPGRPIGVGALAAVWLVLPWLVGMAMRAFRRVKARAADAERRGHVYQERLRIAREVHDVVGHSLAVINMQAGVALHVLDRRPERAAEALRVMRETSASALEELRAALAPLDGPPPAGEQPYGLARDRHPAPGLGRLPELVDAVSHAGLRVELVVEGQRRELPAAVDLAGYRIVQESLTNVVRHAVARTATVRVVYDEQTVSVTVTDDGRGPTAVDTAGRGLVGMRERAVAVGGAFTAGAGGGGGFEVRAVLPFTGLGGCSSTRG